MKCYRPAHHNRVKIDAYLEQQAGGPRPGARLPVPGYFPVMRIFPGFGGSKIPGYVACTTRLWFPQVFDQKVFNSVS
jgi:hypothetical protein